MKILAVCGFGCGSSLILKMGIEKALKKLNIDAVVENTDLTGVSMTDADLILASSELLDSIKEKTNVTAYPIEKFMDLEEIIQKIQYFMKKGE